jgi:inorganic pyrophosphatase
MGSTTVCKVLGSIVMVDTGTKETDQKVICIAKNSECYAQIDGMNDLEKFYPGTATQLVTWLKCYKTTDGKGINRLANNEEPLSASEAVDVINETRGHWKKMCGSSAAFSKFALERCPPKANLF